MGISRPEDETLMTTRTHHNPRKHLGWLVAGTSAALALAAMGFANTTHARNNVTLSVGIGVPGVAIGATNAYPVYTQPQVVYSQPQIVYSQPRPVYMQLRPVWVQPDPVYYQPAPVYLQPAPVYYPQAAYYGHRHGHHWEGPREGHGEDYGPGYFRGQPQVYYRR